LSDLKERTILQILLIALAGSVGALSRYGLSSLVSNVFGDKFALGTLTVNVIGCFLIGFVMHISLSTDIISVDIRNAVTIGFLGALTTFSTFSYETFKYIEDAQWIYAGANVALNVILGLIATIIGLAAARLIVGGS
jgi:CrcB protein